MAEQEQHELTKQAADTHGHGSVFYENPVFWVGVAFFAFVALIIWQKVPKMIADALDKRADGIRDQLDEARKLREEAQALLAEYQRKQRDAETEAAQIIEQAREDAERVRGEAQVALGESIERRASTAQDKIAQAEAAAIKEVQSVAVTIATEVARKLIGEQLDESRSNELVDQSISDLSRNLQ